MIAKDIVQKLSAVQGLDVREADYEKTRCNVDVLATPETFRDFAKVVREAGLLIESLTAVDAVPMMVVCHFTSVYEVCRVVGRVLIDRENPVCPTISDIFPGANWHERETRDFFGVKFEGHPDMTPLILPEDQTDFHPLRKGEGKLKNLSELIGRFAPAKENAEVSE
jgi:NADH-quinone oxidoreductase subunit C